MTTLAIHAAPKRQSAPIAATFSRQRAADLDSVARALLLTLNGSEIVAECANEEEARRVRLRIPQACSHRIRFNHWFYIATRLTKAEPTRVYAWLVHLTREEVVRNYRLWKPERVAQMLVEPPVCELKLRRVATLFDDGAEV